MVLAADCLPVALGCTGAVAMVHAGWRGLAARRARAGRAGAARARRRREPIVAVIGPGAGVCCYEVGAEVHARFGGAHGDGRHIDLRAIARERLLAAGVADVRDVEACTICDAALLLPPARRRARRAPGGSRVVELITACAPSACARTSSRCSAEIAARDRALRPPRRGEREHGRDPGGDQVRRPRGAAGARRRRASASSARTARRSSRRRSAAHGELFEWDFIGQLQSRRVRADRAARAPDPLGRLGVRAARARAPPRARAPGAAHPDRGQRRRRGGQGGRRARAARRVHRALAGARRRA